MTSQVWTPYKYCARPKVEDEEERYWSESIFRNIFTISFHSLHFLPFQTSFSPLLSFLLQILPSTSFFSWLQTVSFSGWERMIIELGFQGKVSKKGNPSMMELQKVTKKDNCGGVQWAPSIAMFDNFRAFVTINNFLSSLLEQHPCLTHFRTVPMSLLKLWHCRLEQ